MGSKTDLDGDNYANDCCELDTRARPGVKTAQARPTYCGGWDFNCDGSETLQWQQLCDYDYNANDGKGGCTMTEIQTGWCDDGEGSGCVGIPGCGEFGRRASGCKQGGSKCNFVNYEPNLTAQKCL